MKNPKISIITVVKNNAKDLENCILSVLIKIIRILNILLLMENQLMELSI